MKTKIFFLLCILWTLESTYAQIVVTGKIIDKQEQVVAFADVLLVNEKDSILTYTLSDESGFFTLETFHKPHKIKGLLFSNLLFEKEITTEGNIDLGNIEVESSLKLQEVVVIQDNKKAFEQKADKFVFNVENSIKSNGGSALDLLKATPSVDANDKGIGIIGKQSVRVMINERLVMLSGEELVNYLQSIASSNIKSIEVLTNPPAKYDAEGNSGLINIVLKAPKEDSWSNQFRSSYLQTAYTTFEIGNIFNYNNKNLKINASIDGKWGNQKKELLSEIFYPSLFWNDNQTTKHKQDRLSAILALDYDITAKSTLGVSFTGNYVNPDTRSWGKTYISNANTQLGNISNLGSADNKNKNQSFNIHYIQKLDTLGRKLSVDFDHFNYSNEQNRVFNTIRNELVTTHHKTNNLSNQNIKNYSGKIDIEHPFNTLKLGYGAKLSHTKTHNAIALYDITMATPVIDPQQSDTFHYTENLQAFYVDVTKGFSKRLQTQLGLRLENTQTIGLSESYNQENKKKYTQLFPSLAINFTKDESHIFAFSYNRRIKRPAFWELNPFKWYLNANSYSEGNPFLRPEISSNFELKHIYNNKLITKVFASWITSGFGQTILVNPTTYQQIYSRDNYYKGVWYGLNETLMYNPFVWWRTVNQFNLFYIDTQYDNNVNLGSKVSKGWDFQFFSNHTFLFDKEGKWVAETTFMWASKQHRMIFEVEPMAYLDLGLKFTPNKRWSISIGIDDVFNTKTQKIISNTQDIAQYYTNIMDSQQLKISLSYMLGNDKIKNKKYTSGNLEEQNRIE